MSTEQRITQRFPENGSLPSQQTAENGKQQGESRGANHAGMTESDKMIYNLVQNTVDYAGDEFSENLHYNSKVLTNVLYDNIYDLLQGKLEEDQFVKWIAEQLIAAGAITQQQSSGAQQKEQPKEEIVYELDDSAYTDLVDKIGSALELVKANRLNIFKAFSDVENYIKDGSEEQRKQDEKNDRELLERRDREIQSLVKKIQGNQEKIDEYIQTQYQLRQELDAKIDQLIQQQNTRASEQKKQPQSKKTFENIRNLILQIGDAYEQQEKSQQRGKPRQNRSVSPKHVESESDVQQTTNHIKNIQQVDQVKQVEQVEHTTEDVEEQHVLKPSEEAGRKRGSNTVVQQPKTGKQHTVEKQEEVQENASTTERPQAKQKNALQPTKIEPRKTRQKSAFNQSSNSVIRSVVLGNRNEDELEFEPQFDVESPGVVDTGGEGQFKKNESKFSLFETAIPIGESKKAGETKSYGFGSRQIPKSIPIGRSQGSTVDSEFKKSDDHKILDAFQSSKPRIEKDESSETGFDGKPSIDFSTNTGKFLYKDSSGKLKYVDVDFNEVDLLVVENQGNGKRPAQISIGTGKLGSGKPSLFGRTEQVTGKRPEQKVSDFVQKPTKSPLTSKAGSAFKNIQGKILGVGKGKPATGQKQQPSKFKSRIMSFFKKSDAPKTKKGATSGIADKKGFGKGKVDKPKMKAASFFSKMFWFLKPKADAKKKKGDEKKQKKPSFVKRGIAKVRRKLINVKNAVKEKISNSFIGKTYRVIKGVARVVKKTVVLAVKATVLAAKVALKTTKFLLKTAKVAAKAFIVASVATGKALKAGTMFAVRSAKKLYSLIKSKKLMKSLITFSFAPIVTKIGWGMIKWGVRKLWTWIKAAVFKLGGTFRRFFRFGGKFVNSVGTFLKWFGTNSIKASYRFLLKPIAGILVQAFGFAMNFIFAPVNFMKRMIPAIFERVLSIMSDINDAAKDVLHATWGIFRKILFNPITLIVLVGCLVAFFGPRLIKWFKGVFEKIRSDIVPAIVKFAKTLYDIGKGFWNVIVTIGKPMLKFIEYITRPDGWIMKTVGTIVKWIWEFKSYVRKLMLGMGYDSIDLLCASLAGDWIGIAIAIMDDLCGRLWAWIKRQPIVKKITNIIKALVGLKRMISDIPATLKASIKGAWNKIIKGEWREIGEAFAEPWVKWWNQIAAIWADNSEYKDEYQQKRELFTINTVDKEKKQKIATLTSFGQLKMKGMYTDDNVKIMERFSQLKGFTSHTSMLNRILKMGQLQDQNSAQVIRYDNFISEIWNLGKEGKDAAAKTLKRLLESPILSEKLLSAFFYVNPQTGQVMTLRPLPYIGQFVKNIRRLVGDDENRDDIQVLKTIVMAMDQTNKERAHIVTQQGKIATDFANQIFLINTQEGKDAAAVRKLEKLATDFNTGDLFAGVSRTSSFEQIKRNDSKSQELVSVTGEKFGTNQLLKVEQIPGTTSGTIGSNSASDFAVPPVKTATPSNVAGNVTLTEKAAPRQSEEEIEEEDKEDSKIRGEYSKYVKQWDESQFDVNKPPSSSSSGGMMDYQQFKEDYIQKNMTQQQQDIRTSKLVSRTAGLRLAKDVEAYQNKGVDVELNDGWLELGSDVNHVPIINLKERELLPQKLYMFSPTWDMINGSSGISDEELKLQITGGQIDEETRKQMKMRQEEEEEQKRAEEIQRQREQEILDYSATVSGGYIEVKIGEDETDMHETYMAYMSKRDDKMLKEHLTEEQLAEAGFPYYTYEEWKKKYRKDRGLPEDGIKRYKFEGKRKERKIDWSERSALSIDEMKKHGITKSETGPVMIPMSKAMELATSLFEGAKKIYSIRDGLEVMRLGIDYETEELRKRKAGGANVVGVSAQTSPNRGSVTVQRPESQPEAPKAAE